MIKTSNQTIIIPSQYYNETEDGNENGGGVESGCTVIDINVGEEEEEKVCRICQLGRSDQVHAGVGGNNNRIGNLVQLGCNCKADLALVHYNCAFTWFKQRGNRTCEICGKPAKNIEGIEDTGFRAFSTENTVGENATISDPSEDPRQRRSKTLCNYILIVLVVSLFLSWAIHAIFASKSH